MTTNTVPIGDLAVIGDCRSVALIARDGTLNWLCWPMFSSAALFAGLLDADGGSFGIAPVGLAEHTRGYGADTNVLVSRTVTAQGCYQTTDFMPIPGPGDDIRPERELIRIVQGVDGWPRIRVTFAPRPNFGQAPLRLRRRGAGGWSFSARGETTWLRSSTELAVAADGRSLAAEFTLAPGETAVFWLGHAVAQPTIIPDLSACHDRLEETCAFWREWIGRCTYRGSHQAIVRRSLLALKLLTYAPSGAVVAAATTSLPEAPGADRNWDYRYCWLRDSSLTFRVFNDTGYPEEAARYLRWLILSTRLSAPRLNVVYDVYGRGGLDETVLAHFQGWRGSRPVRVGNDAHKQFQLDLYGEAMAAAADFAAHGGRITPLQALSVLGWADTVGEEWRKPDRGIWEVRTPPKHFTYSKVMAWVTLDALARLVREGQVPDRPGLVAGLSRQRDEIAQAIESQGVDPRGQGYVAAFGEDEVDASLLLLPWFGYADARSPRMRATTLRVVRELGHGALVKRYRTGYDGFESREGAFMACGFWAADCLARSGELAEAERRFAELVGYANDLGLMAEEVDPDSGAQLGNFPQAFSHVAAVNAAMTLADVGHGR